MNLQIRANQRSGDLPMPEDNSSPASYETEKIKMRPKRSKNKIVSEILEICLEGTNKTRIVYQANLNFKTVNSYLDLLINNSMIVVTKGPKKIYTTTEKGRELLSNYDRVKDETAWF
jgi:predicted transcriptional regulator